MIKHYRLSLIFALITLVIGLATLFVVGPDARIPSNYGLNGEVIRYRGAWPLLAAMPLLQGLTVGIFLGLRLLEPRSKHLNLSAPAVGHMASAITGMLLVIQLVFCAQGLGWMEEGFGWVSVAMGVMMVIVGNYLPKLRSNFFVGVRTPWTLSSEDNWRRTHRLSGPLFMLAGVLMILGGATDAVRVDILILGAVLPAVLIPGLYSYVIWRREGGNAASD